MTCSTLSVKLSYQPVRLAVAVVALVGLNPPLMAEGEVNTGYFGNVTVEGYDPVAYFTEGQATAGSEDHTFKWLGANWRFATAEHTSPATSQGPCFVEPGTVFTKRKRARDTSAGCSGNRV